MADSSHEGRTGRAELLYAWLVEELDGREGIIAAGVVIGGHVRPPMPLVTTRQEIAELYREAAKAHGKAAGRPVRLGVFGRVS